MPPPGKFVGLHDTPVAKRRARADQAVATGHNGLVVTGEQCRADDEGQNQAKRERDTPEQARRTRSEAELRTHDKIKRRAARDRYTGEHNQRE